MFTSFLFDNELAAVAGSVRGLFRSGQENTEKKSSQKPRKIAVIPFMKLRIFSSTTWINNAKKPMLFIKLQREKTHILLTNSWRSKIVLITIILT